MASRERWSLLATSEMLNSKTVMNGEKYGKQHNQNRRERNRKPKKKDLSESFVHPLGELTKLSMQFEHCQVEIIIEKEGTEGRKVKYVTKTTKSTKSTPEVEVIIATKDDHRRSYRDAILEDEEEVYSGAEPRKLVQHSVFNENASFKLKEEES